MTHYQATSSTFEFLHACCCKFPSEVDRGGDVSMLKRSSPLFYGFLHLCFVFDFGIVNSLLEGREIYKVICLRVTLKGKHKLV